MSPVFGSSKASRIRKADHAGSWYTDNAHALQAELEAYLNDAADKLDRESAASAPIENARVIIAPHAGYRYSGPTAGVAYKALDLRPTTKNVFVLGPSHHVHLETAAVSGCDELETPLGNLIVNKDISAELQTSPLFGVVARRNEEAEHSMEMHFPFVKLLIDKVFPNAPPQQQPKVVPIMIGNTSAAVERTIGEALSPYLKDANNVFVVSSDFAHWGRRFGYTYYTSTIDESAGFNIKSNSQVRPSVPIHQSIEVVDKACMEVISTGDHDSFLQILSETGNTVCGRHPIGVVLCAIRGLLDETSAEGAKYRFKFTDYQRSGLVSDYDDSSVSYASAYAVI